MHAALRDKTPLTTTHLSRRLALGTATNAVTNSGLVKLQARGIVWSFNRRHNGPSADESQLPRPPLHEQVDSVTSQRSPWRSSHV